MLMPWRCLILLLLLAVGLPAGAAQERAEILLTVTEYPPLLDPKLPGQGPWAELVRTVFVEAGYPLRVEFRPWTRVLGEAAAAREAERVVLLRPAPGRELHFRFSEPLLDVEVVLLKRRGHALSAATLRQYSVGYVENSALPEAFLRLPFARRETALTYELNVRKLLAGRIDSMLIDRAIYRWYLSQLDAPDAVEPVDGLLFRQSVHLGVPLNNPHGERLLRDFHSALRRLRGQGRLPPAPRP
ncbi:MAG: transporter substrate-binding domain-containing protein [Gammaproteobacteria bacterium]|nr:transporter substrate-binding domain-containing protein [Gammaproteobacteria bacterium]